MLKNKKIQINLNEGISAAAKLKLRAANKKLKRSLFAMNCRACNYDCHNACFAMFRQYRVNEIEIAGGKSDFLYSVDTLERTETVPVEVYQQLLQAFSDLKAGQTSDHPTASEKQSGNVDTQPDARSGDEKKPSKTRSDAPAEAKANKSPGKTIEIPPITAVESDPFEGLDAGIKEKSKIPF